MNDATWLYTIPDLLSRKALLENKRSQYKRSKSLLDTLEKEIRITEKRIDYRMKEVLPYLRHKKRTLGELYRELGELREQEASLIKIIEKDETRNKISISILKCREEAQYLIKYTQDQIKIQLGKEKGPTLKDLLCTYPNKERRIKYKKPPSK